MKVLSSSQMLHCVTLFNYISVFITATERTRGNLRQQNNTSLNRIVGRRNRPDQIKTGKDENRTFLKTAVGEIEGGEIKQAENIFIRSRIIGGVDTEKDQYKYTVNLVKSNGSHICGGSLIANNFVLTAAHCDGHFDRVQIGRYDLADKSENFEVFSISERFVHEDYDSKYLKNDIMLLKLDRPSTSPTVPLDRGGTSQNNLYVLGWGVIDSQDNSYEGKLQEATLDLIPNDLCQGSTGYVNGVYASYYGLVQKSMICAYNKYSDACFGDSGGPLISKNLKGGGDTLVGIVSWGFGCAHTDFPGVYTRIESYLDWIDSIVCMLTEDKDGFICPQKRPVSGPDACRTTCRYGFQCRNGTCVHKKTRTKNDRNRGS